MRLTLPWAATEHHNGNGYSGKLDELRAALGKEVDHLAKVAAQLSQEIGAKASAATSEVGAQAGTAASDVAREAQTAAKDVQASASGIASKIVEGAVALGPTIALMGRKRAETLASDVQSIGQDLRRVRLTTEPRKTTPDFMPGITLLGGFGAGIALMYFLDPDRGRRRRAMLRDQLNKWTRVGREAASGKAKDLRNRAEGAVIEARKAIVPVQPEQEPETTTFETYAYGSTQTPESPETSERETSATIG